MNMTPRKLFMRHVLPAALAALLAAPASPADLDQVLAAMDDASRKIFAVKARITKASYTAVIDDTTVEKGAMWMARERKGRGKPKVRMRIEFTEPDPRSVAFAGNKAEIYYPKIKTVHEYDLGKHKALVESFLLLGFGSSGKDLAKDYEIRLAGEEEVEGTPAWKLELTPKSKKAREKIVKVELWLAKKGAYPVRQRFHAPSGDTTTITYTEVELNPKLTRADLELKLPAGVKREYPQR